MNGIQQGIIVVYVAIIIPNNMEVFTEKFENVDLYAKKIVQTKFDNFMFFLK